MMAQAKPLMTIGEVSRATGVARTALRYYEGAGILAPMARNRAGYRLYEAQAVERLRFIRSAQAIGFNLDDIRTLLKLDQSQGKSCQTEVQQLLERRLADVDEKMKELRRVRRALRRALDQCRQSNGECSVLKDLSSSQSKRRRR